jgi:DNA transformation protein
MDSEYLRELFERFRPVSIRRMFSGAGVFADGLMFALVVDGVVYLKVDDNNLADFDAENLPPFSYLRAGAMCALPSYRRMPDRLYDDPGELAQWAARAFAAAVSNAAPRRKPARQQKKPAGSRAKSAS